MRRLVWHVKASAVMLRFVSADKVSSAMNDLMLAFAEARELIADAKESAGTTYYSDDAEDAKVQSEKVLGTWKELKAQLTLDGNTAVLSGLEREYDVKFRQLEAELADALHHDED